MKTKTVGTLLIAGLVVLSAMVVFATPAMAEPIIEEDSDGNPILEDDPEGTSDDPIRFKGTILKADGTPDAGRILLLQKKSTVFGCWWIGWTARTNNDGEYETNYCSVWENGGRYRMLLRYGFCDWRVVETRDLTEGNFDNDHGCHWTYWWNHPIPEFSTIALPVASILGLLFFFNHRKRRKE